MIKKIVILFGIIQSILCYASEKNNESVVFTKIKSEIDIKVFSGNIIAYKTPSDYFKGSPFKDKQGKQHFYGYISEDTTISGTDRRCYVLFKVISGLGKHKACLLTNEKIKNSSLYVREATPEELKKLNQGLQKKILTFPYNSPAAKKAIQESLDRAK